MELPDHSSASAGSPMHAAGEREETRVVGVATPHDSAVRHAAGSARYVDDLPEPAGTLHVAVRGAPAARGAITCIDLDAVRRAPGVVAVLTAADIPGRNDVSAVMGDDPMLADGRIEFHGQVVLAVAAESRDLARRAARLATIEIAAEAPVVTVDDALAAVAVAAVLLGRTIKGFEIKVAGAAPQAAKFAGFDADRLTILTFAISGALAGLAGIVEVAGPVGHLQPNFSPGYGFTAIIVAFLGRLNPDGILVAALFLALTFIGGEQAQISIKVPLDLTKVFQGLLLFYVLACDSLILYRIRILSYRRGAADGSV